MRTEPAGRAQRRRQRLPVRGFTLVEMVLAIIVLGVGLAGVMMAFSVAVRGSVDPLLSQQMLAIAEELLEEVQLKPFAAAPHSPPAGCARDSFNDINDFHGYATSGQVCTVDGQAIAALAGYSVSVTVVAMPLDGVAAARRITVTVTHGAESLVLTGWRTDWAS